ncbi:MAG: SIS domain-containing protein [Clostridiaceae bacterium]|nr:SIS domain-containing protein [Eubacteriales bacterium]
MLNVDKKDVDFLVTGNMVTEVNSIMARDFPLVDKIVASLDGIERVYFVACGSPLCACQTAKQLFSLYSDIPCEAYSGWDFLDQAPAKLDRHCLVIGVSQSGTTQEVVDSVKLARARGAFTVALTNSASGNPLAEAVERVIGYGAECIWEAHLLLGFRFAMQLIRAAGPSPELDALEADMQKLPTVLERLVAETEEKSKVRALGSLDWNLVYSVASGPLLPLAYKEGIITMLEFTWTNGSCISAAEFRHGPLEVVDEKACYLILIGNDASRHTSVRAADFIRRYTKNVVVFDVLDYAEGLHPMLSPFILFVPLEYYFFYLAIGKDHNPDERRYYGGLAAY